VSEQVVFKLNGKEVSVPKGWTVMQAAAREGVRIPHFCWHPALEIAGVCRFCMVEVKGRPKLEIACNLKVEPNRDGSPMEVNTVSETVKDAHKWALEFHLINHPLDCPICDQAGECKLQDFYMEVGKYKSQMTRPKVLKPKALDVGSELILDTERCILCSRCVRFEEEVTKTNALGIFDRGDRAIIGTYSEEKLHHEYQENLVDICPVGAFTSKTFRFKQRVWFLKEKESICPGCSTGCRISVHGKPEERMYYRIKPVLDEEVNGYWMCDQGRKTYQHQNIEERLEYATYTVDDKKKEGSCEEGLRALAHTLKHTPPEDVALLVSAQYTTEEFRSFFHYFVKDLGIKKIFQWREPTEKTDSFDGILLRGDHNANSFGLQNIFEEFNLVRPIQNEFETCLKSGAKVLVALCPELPMSFPSLKSQLETLSVFSSTYLWTSQLMIKELADFANVIPMKTFFEKKGHVFNYKKLERTLSSPFPSVVFGAKDVCEAVDALRGTEFKEAAHGHH
jgi:NADH-quinone oxidoreductase subunit G